MQMKTENYSPNQRGWRPTEDDYVLVFMPVDGLWRELSHDIPKYANMVLSDYLAEIGLFVPDDCQFMRIVSDTEYIEYRAYDCNRVVIHYQKNTWK